MKIAEKCAERQRIGVNEKKKWLYDGVIVPTALNGAEAWGMRGTERISLV